jgi:hypothetical protein
VSKAWARDQRVIKLRYGTIQKWKQLATQLGLDENRTVRVLLDLTADFVINRRIWLSAQELSKQLAPGAAAHMASLGLAENRNGQVVLLDVERTVNESLAPRQRAEAALPAVRARDLGTLLAALHLEVRGKPYPEQRDRRVGSRPAAREPQGLRRFSRRGKMHCSRRYPPVNSYADLDSHPEPFSCDDA